MLSMKIAPTLSLHIVERVCEGRFVLGSNAITFGAYEGNFDGFSSRKIEELVDNEEVGFVIFKDFVKLILGDSVGNES